MAQILGTGFETTSVYCTL